MSPVPLPGVLRMAPAQVVLVVRPARNARRSKDRTTLHALRSNGLATGGQRQWCNQHSDATAASPYHQSYRMGADGGMPLFYRN